jgi:hypothetical protein
MATDPGFRLHYDTTEDLTRVKKWCKDNRIPYGRLMNNILKALGVLELATYDQIQSCGGLILTVALPPRINLDNQESYQAKKALVNDRINSRS